MIVNDAGREAWNASPRREISSPRSIGENAAVAAIDRRALGRRLNTETIVAYAQHGRGQEGARQDRLESLTKRRAARGPGEGVRSGEEV